MKKHVRKGIMVFFLAIFVVSGVLVVNHLQDYRVAEQTYEEAKNIAANHEPAAGVSISAGISELPDDPVALAPEPEEPALDPLSPEGIFHYLSGLDLTALQEVNDDVFGWIYIPGSTVDYPLLQGNDNSRYLYRAWDNTSNSSGSIFLDYENDRGLSDSNSIIYGHHMKNDTMFAPLCNYKDPLYWDSHPHVYIAADDGIRRYRIFAAKEEDVTSSVFETTFESEEGRILTLSTCTGDGTYDTRWILQAVWEETIPVTPPDGEPN